MNYVAQQDTMYNPGLGHTTGCIWIWPHIGWCYGISVTLLSVDMSCLAMYEKCFNI